MILQNILCIFNISKRICILNPTKKNAIAFWDQHKDIRDWMDAEMFYALKDRETLSDDDIVKSIDELFGVVINKAWIKHS